MDFKEKQCFRNGKTSSGTVGVGQPEVETLLGERILPEKILSKYCPGTCLRSLSEKTRKLGEGTSLEMSACPRKLSRLSKVTGNGENSCSHFGPKRGQLRGETAFAMTPRLGLPEMLEASEIEI